MPYFIEDISLAYLNLNLSAPPPFYAIFTYFLTLSFFSFFFVDFVSIFIFFSNVSIWFGMILWHINQYRLFNAKSIFIHVNGSILFFLVMFRFGLVWFYGISTSIGYLMPNPFLFM